MNAVDNDGQTPLHYATNVETVDFLFCHGAVIQYSNMYELPFVNKNKDILSYYQKIKVIVFVFVFIF